MAALDETLGDLPHGGLAQDLGGFPLALVIAEGDSWPRKRREF